MAEFTSFRRYCLDKRISAMRVGDDAIASLWQSKQEAQAGTALPADFPSRSKLVAAGYTTNADLVGADVRELRDYARLSKREADSVIAAAAAL
jgi:hypothetical protein